MLLPRSSALNETITYEAQAAMELRSLVDPAELGYYPVQVNDENIDVKLMFAINDARHNKQNCAISNAAIS